MLSKFTRTTSSMNVYLDIDGVLLANEHALAPHAEEFLIAILDKYPDSTYWLTTHCWQGENRACDVLAPFLNSNTVELIKTIKPTNWGEAKTDAIDFTKPFLWFDDDLYPKEREVLAKHNALAGWIEVNLQKDPNMLKELIPSS